MRRMRRSEQNAGSAGGDLGLRFDHTRGDHDEAQTQRVESGDGRARFGIAARKPRISQLAPACRNSRNWLAVALEEDVRWPVRCVFQDLMWFSAAPRRQYSPLLDDGIPPSKRAITDLPVTDDKPLRGGRSGVSGNN